MIRSNKAFAVPENGVDRLNDAVWRQTSILFGKIHASAGSVHADAEFLRGRKLRVNQKVARRTRENIMMIKTGGAAGFQQLAQPCEGGKAHHLPVKVFPDFIERRQPIEQLKSLHGGKVAGKNLIQMVVRVDQSRIAEHVRSVKRFAVRRKPLPHGADYAVFYEQIGMRKHAAAIIAGDDSAEVF